MYEILLTIVVTLGLGLYSLYKWFTKKHDYFEKRRIPYVKFTELGKAGRKITDFLQYIYNRYPEEK